MESALLKEEFPDLYKEIHPIKNRPIRLETIRSDAGIKLWWICGKGHEWETSIRHRTKEKSGCPYCYGRYAIPGENDLQTVNPVIASEWNWDRNMGRIPSAFKPGSNLAVWWKCKKGHEWKAAICDRTRKRGSNCPYCSGNICIKGENDLKTTYPEIAKQWNKKENGELVPEEFSRHSGKKVWWVCDKGHEWQATIISRTKLKAGCPYCMKKKAIKGETDLETSAPEIVEEWNFSRNGNLYPSNVTISSGRKVWWICKNGHEWQAVINTRTGKGRCGCPYCYGRYAITGETDLYTLMPELTCEWDTRKNKLLCSEVKTFSNKKVWWMCEKGHEWRTMISTRSRGRGCPYCNK